MRRSRRSSKSTKPVRAVSSSHSLHSCIRYLTRAKLTGLEARRDRRRQNVLIRKDRSLAATAVGATAAAKLKKSKSKQRPAMTASGSNHSSDDDDEENALETTGYRKRKKGKGTKDVRSRKKVAGLDRPQHVGQGRLTVSHRCPGSFPSETARR
jgi:hypothetical protein